MELTYQGGHDAVNVTLPSGAVAEVANGDSYDFPDELAKRLLEQPLNWKKKPVVKPAQTNAARAAAKE